MADERKVYAMCGSNCKYETLTKEQILTAIQQAVSTGIVSDVDAGFITKIVEQNGNNLVKIWVGTQAQYNALPEIDNNTLYITDDSDQLSIILKNVEQMRSEVDSIADGIREEVNDISSDVQAMKDGTVTVKNAQNAETAETLVIGSLEEIDNIPSLKTVAFTAHQDITINGTMLPAYSKGILVKATDNIILLAVDPYGYMYYAYKGGEWSAMTKISASADSDTAAAFIARDGSKIDFASNFPYLSSNSGTTFRNDREPLKLKTARTGLYFIPEHNMFFVLRDAFKNSVGGPWRIWTAGERVYLDIFEGNEYCVIEHYLTEDSNGNAVIEKARYTTSGTIYGGLTKEVISTDNQFTYTRVCDFEIDENIYFD